MPAVPRVAVVTGAVSHSAAFQPANLTTLLAQNRGIGRAICEFLAQDQTSPLVLYAASRAGTPPELSSPTVDVRPARLSLTDPSSASSLAAAIQAEHGGCDVVINNAGVYYYREKITTQQRRETFDANYRGTLRVCQAFIPIMRPGGRIVNLSSQSGQLHCLAPELRQRFLEPDLTLAQLCDLVAEYNVSTLASQSQDSRANPRRRTPPQRARKSHAAGPPWPTSPARPP